MVVCRELSFGHFTCCGGTSTTRKENARYAPRNSCRESGDMANYSWYSFWISCVKGSRTCPDFELCDLASSRETCFFRCLQSIDEQRLPWLRLRFGIMPHNRYSRRLILNHSPYSREPPWSREVENDVSRTLSAATDKSLITSSPCAPERYS